MIRNLKVLSMAMMAVFAMSAVAASSAFAGGAQVTADGPVILQGTELSGNSFQYPGLPKTTCNDSTFHIGEVEETPHGSVSPGTETLTVAPTYKNCKVGIFPATVITTDCDYDFTLEAGGAVSATLTCEDDDVLHLEAYSDAGHTNRICTVTFGEQEPSSELTATNNEGTVTVAGEVTGIEATKSGGGCGGPGETTEASYVVNVEVTGENEEEEATPVSISDREKGQSSQALQAP